MLNFRNVQLHSTDASSSSDLLIHKSDMDNCKYQIQALKN